MKHKSKKASPTSEALERVRAASERADEAARAAKKRVRSTKLELKAAKKSLKSAEKAARAARKDAHRAFKKLKSKRSRKAARGNPSAEGQGSRVKNVAAAKPVPRRRRAGKKSSTSVAMPQRATHSSGVATEDRPASPGSLPM